MLLSAFSKHGTHSQIIIRFDPHHAWIRNHTPLLAASQRYFTAPPPILGLLGWKTPREKLGPVVKEEGKRYPGYCLNSTWPKHPGKTLPMAFTSRKPESAARFSMDTALCRSWSHEEPGSCSRAPLQIAVLSQAVALAGSQLVMKSCLGWRENIQLTENSVGCLFLNEVLKIILIK